MQISAEAAQLFSEALLQIYAAMTDDGLREGLEAAEKVLKAEPWLLGLLHGHAQHRREQLRQLNRSAETSIVNLTEREIEVLQRIALGETDGAIAKELGIAPKTASKHVENILRKLGVATRTAAAATVHRRGRPG